MLGHKVEETDQMFHTSHKFCHKICYPHPPGHDMSEKIVFALSLTSTQTFQEKQSHATALSKCQKVQEDVQKCKKQNESGV